MMFVVPLKKAWRRKRHRRAEAAMKFLRAFIARHTKTPPELVKISNKVNEAIWRHGMNSPPRKLRVVVEKKDNFVIVELPGDRGARKEEPNEKS